MTPTTQTGTQNSNSGQVVISDSLREQEEQAFAAMFPEPLVDLAEAAKLIGVPKYNLVEVSRKGGLPIKQIGVKQLVTRAAMVAFLMSGENAPPKKNGAPRSTGNGGSRSGAGRPTGTTKKPAAAKTGDTAEVVETDTTSA